MKFKDTPIQTIFDENIPIFLLTPIPHRMAPVTIYLHR